MSWSGVRKICSAVKGGGVEACQRQGNSGRKRTTNQREDRKMVREATSEASPNAAVLATNHEARTHKKISSTTVKRRMKEAGIRRCLKCKKPYVNDGHRKVRLDWARKHVHWSPDDWKRVLWSDESPFTIRYKAQQWVWRTPAEKYHPRCLSGTVKSTKYSKKLMVWGCFAGTKMGRLCRIEGIMNAKKYHGILQGQMLPSASDIFNDDDDWTFMHDNDPKHTANLIKLYLSNKNVKVMKWPAGSPDLNPIENLRAEFDRAAADRKPQNETQLYEILQHTWESIKPEYLQNLINSMPRRCKAVIEANGGQTKY